MATSEQPGASAGPPLVSQFVSRGSREDGYSLPCSLGLTLAVQFLFLLDGAPRPWSSFIDTCNHRYRRWLPYAETRRTISGGFLLWRSHLEGLWRISQGSMLVWFGKFSYCLLWNNKFLFARINIQSACPTGHSIPPCPRWIPVPVLGLSFLPEPGAVPQSPGSGSGTGLWACTLKVWTKQRRVFQESFALHSLAS